MSGELTKLESTGSVFENDDNTLRRLQLTGGLGDFTAANALTMYGLNHMKMPLPTSGNKDSQGYVFFTRPDLNLSYHNLAQDRQFALMINNPNDSVWGYVRAVLAGRGAKDYPSPFVNPNNPFIPILTNNLKNLSGWSEVTVDPQTSDAGIYNEAHSMADGFSKDYSVKNLNATFSNQIGDPLNKLFTTWTRYSMMVKEGVMDPYLEYLIMNIIDYNTRIYVLVMDPTKRFIQNIAATGAAFPLNSQLAAKFDYDKEKPLKDSSDDISIQFQCMGMIYDDPILMAEFNMLVDAFCPMISQGKYKKLTGEEVKAHNMLGIPRINTETGQLDWYVSPNNYMGKLDAGDSKRDNGTLANQNYNQSIRF